MKIGGKTKLYGIIGNPVEHSLSPRFQARFIGQGGHDAVYLPFRVEEEELEAAIRGLWALNVQGFNVTVPYKELVIPYVQVDQCAGVIGAVNTVIRSASGWTATNTDWVGFSKALEALGGDVQGATVLLFGAGGTAKAVVYALAQCGIGRLYICNRGRERAETLAAHTREHYSHIHCELVKWGDKDVEAGCLESKIVINTTSIGLKDDETFPFALAGDGVAVDAVYRPDGNTAFRTAAGRSGRLSIDGLPMLVAQGAESFARWFEVPCPDVIEAFRWMESQLGRRPADLPGWEKA